MAYETSGMLSYHAITDPQAVQAERGPTGEGRSGRRAASKVKKLPSAKPGAETKGFPGIPAGTVMIVSKSSVWMDWPRTTSEPTSGPSTLEDVSSCTLFV